MEKLNGYHNDLKIESEITCPYCGYRYTDSHEKTNSEDEWTDNLECPACERKFKATCVVTIDYRTSKDCVLNNEKHEFQKAWWSKSENNQECKKCGFVKWLKI